MKQQLAGVAQTKKNDQSLLTVSFEEFNSYRQKILELVARRAYEIFESRGRVHGRDWEDWFQAESEKLRPVHAELSDTGDAFIAVAAVSSCRLDHVRVSADTHRLWICGLPPLADAMPDEKKHGQVHSGPFLRSFCLPAEISPSEIRTTIREDILKVCMPKIVPKSKV